MSERRIDPADADQFPVEVAQNTVAGRVSQFVIDLGVATLGRGHGGLVAVDIRSGDGDAQTSISGSQLRCGAGVAP